MKINSKPKAVLALVLSVVLITTGCSAQWISVALADLPVLTQMALNIATVITALRYGKQLSPGEAATIQNISAESSRDLNLLQTLYQQYKNEPNPSNLQKIQETISLIDQNLQNLLQSAHISNSILSARIGAAVSLILSTVNSFASLIPQTTTHSASQRVSVRNISIPNKQELKSQWNRQVCAPTGDFQLDTAFAACALQ
jgi:hypothetical protein